MNRQSSRPILLAGMRKREEQRMNGQKGPRALIVVPRGAASAFRGVMAD